MDVPGDIRIRLEGNLERLEAATRRVRLSVKRLAANEPPGLVETVSLLEHRDTREAVKALERLAPAAPVLRDTLESFGDAVRELERAVPRALRRIRQPTAGSRLDSARRLDDEQLLFSELVIPKALLLLPAAAASVACFVGMGAPLAAAWFPLLPVTFTSWLALRAVRWVTLTNRRLYFNGRVFELGQLKRIRVWSSLATAQTGYNASTVQVDLLGPVGPVATLRFPGAPRELLAGLRRLPLEVEVAL